MNPRIAIVLRATVFGAVGLFLTGCGEESGPVKLGLIAGLSGSNTDLGQAGRNGAMLATEHINQNGGIDGRPIELSIRDDTNNGDVAKAAAQALIDEKVEVIVGPFTSTMAKNVREITEPAKMLVFAPTASSTAFSGIDDYFLRLCSSSADNAGSYAVRMTQKKPGIRISAAIDSTNSVFTKAYFKDFSERFLALNGEIVHETWLNFNDQSDYQSVVDALREPKPDAIFMVANAVAVARLAQRFRQADTETTLIAAEWAGTQQLVELGGAAVEGVQVHQIFNKFGTSEKFLNFSKAYRNRFDEDPSFSSIIAYEVVQVIAKAMATKTEGQDLKTAILENGPYEGLQQELELDAFGDIVRKSFPVEVKGADFVPVN